MEVTDRFGNPGLVLDDQPQGSYTERSTKERLVEASFVPPSTIKLVFADGLRMALNKKRMEMPDTIRWDTIELAPGGDKITVKGVKRDVIPIDSGTLRYLSDEEYKAKIDADYKAIQFTSEELEELCKTNPPSPEWFFGPGEDLVRESWK